MADRPHEVADGFLRAWKVAQDRYLNRIHECFHPIPILMAPLMVRDVVGVEALSNLGGLIYGVGDPTKLFHEGPTQQITTKDGRHILTLRFRPASLDLIPESTKRHIRAANREMLLA